LKATWKDQVIAEPDPICLVNVAHQSLTSIFLRQRTGLDCSIRLPWLSLWVVQQSGLTIEV
jgi:hypothetical protein